MSKSSVRTISVALAFLTTIFVSGAARAADEEIQIYNDDMDKPGQFGLDIHNNYVVSGRNPMDYAGEQASVHRYRMTPEWSYGVTPTIELGAYLPLTTLGPDGKFNVDGVKGRIKYIAPHTEDQKWFWGVNFELGEVAKHLDINPWNAELKGIAGMHSGPWELTFNANLDFVVSGPESTPATFDFDTKVAYSLSKDFAIGLESYNGAGDTRHFAEFSKSDQSIWATTYFNWKGLAFESGAGLGYGSNQDHWTLKTIVSVPIDGPLE